MRARRLIIRPWLWAVLWFACCCCGAQVSELRSASAIAYDAAGNLFIADGLGNRVWEATLAGKLVAVAGTGVQGFAGDGGLATQAELNEPLGIAIAMDGSLWIADTGNNRLRRVGLDGVVATVAGTGVAGMGGDGASASTALLRRPTALGAEASGGVLVCDTGNERVRRVLAGVISTVAGSGEQGTDGGGVVSAAAAKLDELLGVVSTASGDVIVADSHNHRLRRVAADGFVYPFAGTGIPGYAGDGGNALAARLAFPQGLAVLPDGGLLLADSGNERLREVDSQGVITTVAGSGLEGNGADGGVQTASALHSPRAAAVSHYGMPAVADTRNAAVRVMVGGQNLYLPAALAPGRASQVVASALPATYGESTVGVAVSGMAGVPQGGVAVADGTASAGMAVLGEASAQVGLPTLGAGSHVLEVSYLGDGLNPATTATILTDVQPRPVLANAASAAMQYGAVPPVLSGDVAGVLTQDLGRVQAKFAAQTGGDLVVPGVYPIGATLTGQSAVNYAVSMAPSSGALTVVRATSVLAALNASGYDGLPVALTASVKALSRGTPTGTILFSENGVVVASAPVLTGQAQAQWQPSVGAHQLLVSYAGDGNFLPSAPISAVVTVAALPDFQLGATAVSGVSVNAGSAVDIPFTVASLGGAFSGAVSFSASGLPDGARVSFAPPQVVPGSETTTVTMHVETTASSVGVNTEMGRTTVQLAGMFFVGCLFLRRRRLGLGLALVVVPMLSGCGARSLGVALGAQSKSYSVVLTGTGTNLAGRTVVRSLPIALTVKG